MQPQPMLTCVSVSSSSRWYQRTLGLASAHGGDEYEMLTHDGTLVVQLHEVDAEEHQRSSRTTTRTHSPTTGRSGCATPTATSS
jgi:catechol-2,3-dioxygenase